MREIIKGTYIAEDIIEEKEKEYAEWRQRVRMKKKSQKTAKSESNRSRKKWFGIF